MSAAPIFLPNSVDFGLVAPFSQTVMEVSCGPLSQAVAVTAEIAAPTDPAFGVTSVGPPPKLLVGPGGVIGTSGGASGAPQQSVSGAGVSEEELIVKVEFTAPANGTPSTLAARLEISSPDWSNRVGIPLRARVGNLTIVCPPVSVEQTKNMSVEMTVTNEGPLTEVTLSTVHKELPAGITVEIIPRKFPLGPEHSRSVTLTIIASIDAVLGVSDLTLNWAAFDGLTSFFTTQLTVTKLSLQHSPIEAKYNSDNGNVKKLLGNPIGPEAFCGDYVGQFRIYEHGAIYWSGKSGAAAFEINGPILTRFLHTTNPEVGAPPGFPSESPTPGDYASAPGAAFGYPITDTVLSKSGCYESRFENDSAVYATYLGTFLVSTEASYRASGGSTGPLGLPVADAVGFTSGLGGYLFQDFENGGIYQAARPKTEKPEAVNYSKILQGSGIPFPLPAGSGQTINGTFYLQPNPPAPFHIPQWGLIALDAGLVTTLVQNAFTDMLAAHNKSAQNKIDLQGNATLQNPGVTGYSTLRNLAPMRQYIFGFNIGFGSVTGEIVCNLYFSLDNVDVISGPGQQLSIALLNPAVTLHGDGSKSTLNNIAKEIQNAVTSAPPAVIQLVTTHDIPHGGKNLTVPLQGASIKVLSDGTLCLFIVVGATS